MTPYISISLNFKESHYFLHVTMYMDHTSDYLQIIKLKQSLRWMICLSFEDFKSINQIRSSTPLLSIYDSPRKY
jgi:hypothetical protein